MIYGEWMREIYEKYKTNISNTFIVTGNIGDYACDKTIYVKDYLVSTLLDDFKKSEVYIFIPYKGAYAAKSSSIIDDWDTLINEMAKSNNNTAFIFYYPEFLIPNNAQGEQEAKLVSLHNLLNSPKYITGNNITLFVTESTNNINSMLLGNNCRTSLVNIELPTYNERYSFIYNYVNNHSAIMQRINQRISLEVLANLTAGLQRVYIEDILLYANNKGYLDGNMVIEKKTEVIEKEFGEIVEIYDTAGYSLDDFAGQEEIKKYLKETVIDAIRDDEVDIVPKGIMLMGPPGTGKTFFSRCLAGDSGINFVEFKMSKILGKYVGESEKAMEKALSVFRALAPVGVFMDEIDQSMNRTKGGSDGASSVNANIFGMLLSEMAKPENRGRILWIAATNYPNNVDEALKRAGRFDKKIPFFAPTLSERQKVFELHLKKTKMHLDNDIDTLELAKNTEGYTQAEIEAVVVKALELCKRAKQNTMTMEKLNLALNYMLSNQNNKIREMEDYALRECNDQEFIPQEYRERHRALMKGNVATSDYSAIDRGNNRR